MTLRIRKPGILTTIQDLGRCGNRRFGINPGGAMDRTAARLINTLLGDDDDSAVLEMHFPAAEIEFGPSAVFALGGADFEAILDGIPVDNWRCHRANAGSILSFRAPRKGTRKYLAIAGGINCPKWLNSSSTDLSAGLDGILGRKLQTGDLLETNVGAVLWVLPPNIKVSSALIPRYSRFPTVRIVKGPEFDRLTAKSLQDLVNRQFTVSIDSNRMGYRLVGESLFLLDTIEMLSSPVSFGTIQLLPDGQMIALMADHQTTGGYPRIAEIASVDLPLFAQIGPGDKVMFHLISIEEAEELAVRFENDLCRMKLGVELNAVQ